MKNYPLCLFHVPQTPKLMTFGGGNVCISVDREFMNARGTLQGGVRGLPGRRRKRHLDMEMYVFHDFM